MGLTLEQLQKLGAKPVGVQDLPVEQKAKYFSRVAKRYEEEAKTAKDNKGAALEFVKGAGKGALNTLQGASDIGQKVFGGAARAIVGGPELKRVALPENLTTPSNPAQKAGFATEQVAEFFVPGGVATKGTKLAKIGTSSAKVGAQSAAQEGDVKDGGIDALVNLGLTSAGAKTKGIQEIISKKVPGRILNSIIKPGVNDFNFGKDPGVAVVKEGITGKSLGDLFKKIGSKTNEVGKKIDEEVSKIKGVEVDLVPIYAKVDDAIARAADQGEQALVTRLQTIKDGLVKKFTSKDGKLAVTGDKPLVVSPKEAWEIKKNLAKATKWTGQAFDTEANKVRVDLYKGIASELEKLNPALAGLNKRYASLVTAQKAAERRLNTIKKQNQVGLGDLVSLGAGGLTMGVPGAIGTALVRRAAGSTAVQSNLAQLLSKLEPGEKAAIEKILPALQKIYLGVED